MDKTLAREAAVQLLYEKMSGGENNEESVQLVAELLRDDQHAKKLGQHEKKYAFTLLGGIAEHEAEFRTVIASHLSEGWSIQRINRVDLCVLLLALQEILYTDTPDPVVISEAMKMADLFTEPKNKHFINALLGTVSREKGLKAAVLADDNE